MDRRQKLNYDIPSLPSAQKISSPYLALHSGRPRPIDISPTKRMASEAEEPPAIQLSSNTTSDIATIRKLETQVRMLKSENESLKSQRMSQESKFIDKINFEEQALLEFQREKNYQLDIMQLKFEEELSRVRREKDKIIECYLQQLKSLEQDLVEKRERSNLLEAKANEMSKSLALMEKENIILKQRVEEFETANRIIMAKENQMRTQVALHEQKKLEMQNEIHLLLEFETEKAQTIAGLEKQLELEHQNLQQQINQMLAVRETMTNLENQLRIVTSRLEEQNQYNSSFKIQLDSKQRQIISLKDALMRQKNSLDEACRREKIREKEVLELIGANQKLFNQSNDLKHRIYDLAIVHNFQV